MGALAKTTRLMVTGKTALHLAKARGSVMVEFGLALPIFLFIIIGLTDLIRIGFGTAALHYSLARGTRAASTQAIPSSAPNWVIDQANLIRYQVGKESARFGLNISPSNMAICPYGTSVQNCPLGTGNAGGGGDLVQVRAESNIKLLLGGVSVRMKANALMKNER